MPRRRASPKVEGRSGRRKLAQAASASRSYDGENDFPVDDLPPDDLPVRDISEDQEGQHPPHNVAITAADLTNRDFADPSPGPSADDPGPVNLQSGGGHPTLSAALQHEPVFGTPSPAPQPKAEASKLQAQYPLPGLGSDNSVEPELGPGGKRVVRPRRPRGASAKGTLKAAQIELWPDG
jgi:hypothetical protein